MTTSGGFESVEITNDRVATTIVDNDMTTSQQHPQCQRRHSDRRGSIRILTHTVNDTH